VDWACIVPTWNSGDVILDCLRSVAGQARQFDEVIVVDNGSSDETVAIASRCGITQMLKWPHNMGFAAAVNAGIGASRASGIVLLNADAILDEVFLMEMDKTAEFRPDIDLFAPKIMLTGDYAGRIENVGNGLWLDGLNWCLGRGELDGGQYDKDYIPIFPSGAVCGFRRVVFEDIGCFEEAYFAYGEDAEWGLRAFLRGRKTIFVQRALARHLLSHSLGEGSARKLYLAERNRALTVWKHYPAILALMSVVFCCLRYAGWLTLRLEGSRVRPLRGSLGRWGMMRTLIASQVDALRLICSGAGGERKGGISTVAFLRMTWPHLVSLRDVWMK
jgi:hypothetical protein